MGNLSANFSLHEFQCHGGRCCGHTSAPQVALVEVLQQIRYHFGLPLGINRGFSCNRHNNDIGGNPNSYHVRGAAADCKYLAGISGYKLVEYCKRIPTVGIIILYDSHWHIDIRPRKLGRLLLIDKRTR